jgi:hypothetical protein
MKIRLPSRRMIAAGFVAGLVGAMTLFAFVVARFAVEGQSEATQIPLLFEFTAAAAVGKAVIGNAAYVPLGVVLHVLVSIGWALGYAYAAQHELQLVRRPVISGLGFGLVVYFAMQLVLVQANLFEAPTPASVGLGLLGHCVFFGLPLALVVARMMRD